MDLRKSTWSPFQSLEVRDICAHLTPEEHARVLNDAGERGKQLGQWIAVPFGVAVGSFMWSWQVGSALVLLFVVYMAVSGIPRIRCMRRKTKQLLCETAWARSRGYRPEKLRFMSFPRTK
jgi:hypothetical protein